VSDRVESSEVPRAAPDRAGACGSGVVAVAVPARARARVPRINPTLNRQPSLDGVMRIFSQS
jgi:hypothetical protein